MLTAHTTFEKKVILLIYSCGPRLMIITGNQCNIFLAMKRIDNSENIPGCAHLLCKVKGRDHQGI